MTKNMDNMRDSGANERRGVKHVTLIWITRYNSTHHIYRISFYWTLDTLGWFLGIIKLFMICCPHNISFKGSSQSSDIPRNSTATPCYLYTPNKQARNNPRTSTIWRDRKWSIHRNRLGSFSYVLAHCIHSNYFDGSSFFVVRYFSSNAPCVKLFHEDDAARATNLLPSLSDG